MASARAAIAPAVERILEAAGEVGLDGDRHDDLAVALTEALSNAAIHGNGLKPGTSVRVSVRVVPRVKAVIDIKDSGAGFDPDAVADPTDPVRLLQAGGRGLYMMRRLVDHLEFLDHGSRVRLTMERRRRRT
jgi:anti-sigma regulatory factor (Ser/Thr protein kinase)